MVDSRNWGSLMFARAAGAEGHRAMLRCTIEYLFAGRVWMIFNLCLPAVAFPLIGWIIQAVAPIAPHPDLWEKYGPLGILASWLMWAQLRQERRTDKRDKEQSEFMKAIIAVLHDMRGRPCLYEVEMGSIDSSKKTERSGD